MNAVIAPTIDAYQQTPPRPSGLRVLHVRVSSGNQPTFGRPAFELTLYTTADELVTATREPTYLPIPAGSHPHIIDLRNSDGAVSQDGAASSSVGGRWRFVLESADRNVRIDVEDVENHVSGQRLELLTVIRALEALDQPSQVTLHGGSAYLRQGILFGLVEWRSNDWQWEYFGKMVPVKNTDLWKRIDHLLEYHTIEFKQSPREAVSIRSRDYFRAESNWESPVPASVPTATPEAATEPKRRFPVSQRRGPSADASNRARSRSPRPWSEWIASCRKQVGAALLKTVSTVLS